MKKLLLVAAVLFASANVFAQSAKGKFSITPKVGVSFAKFTGNECDYHSGEILGFNLDADAYGRVGFVAGVEGAYQCSKVFALSAGVFYSLQGAERSGELGSANNDYHWEDKTKWSLGYINIPILANVYVWKGLAIKAGIQPGFLVSAKLKNDVTASGVFQSMENHGTTDLKKGCNKVDLSIPVGLSYEFKKGIVLDGRYNFGLTHISKEEETKNLDKAKNGVLQFTVGYKFKL